MNATCKGTATTKTAADFLLSDLGNVYHYEDHEPMTLGRMLDGIDPT